MLGRGRPAGGGADFVRFARAGKRPATARFDGTKERKDEVAEGEERASSAGSSSIAPAMPGTGSASAGRSSSRPARAMRAFALSLDDPEVLTELGIAHVDAGEFEAARRGLPARAPRKPRSQEVPGPDRSLVRNQGDPNRSKNAPTAAEPGSHFGQSGPPGGSVKVNDPGRVPLSSLNSIYHCECEVSYDAEDMISRRTV